jgi:putative ABC transport system permease protein
MGIFAASAMVLAGLGLYGLLRQFVGARTHEIGVRRALGASSGSIGRLVLSRATGVTAIGVLFGAVLSGAGSRGMSSLLYEASGMDAQTLLVAGVAIFVLVAICSLVPVARALRVDPIVALREE